MLPQKTVNGITFNLRHTMLLVSNLERTVDFYTRQKTVYMDYSV